MQKNKLQYSYFTYLKDVKCRRFKDKDKINFEFYHKKISKWLKFRDELVQDMEKYYQKSKRMEKLNKIV